MRICKCFLSVLVLLSLSLLTFPARGWAAESLDTPAETGTLRGTVTLENNGGALHKATILIVPLGRTTETDETGGYEFRDLPVGAYEVVVQAPALATERRRIQITAGGTATLDFEMRLATLRERVTVTAKGREETAFDSFQAVNVVDTIQLIEKPQTSLGEALDGEPGVAKRSFGPGSARPVIRGFDGDRVLIMKDGISTGTLASQSGDHGETIDLLGLERIEVVKGPATLLYGSNAIGGVVNAITPHGEVHEHVHEGPSGYVSAVGGSANGLGSGGAGFEYGVKNWLMWLSGGGNRTGDYNTPIGEIFNSQTRLANGGGGFGWYGPKAFASLNFGFEDSRYGIPPLEAEVVELKLRRYNPRLTFGFRNLDHPVNSFRLMLDYNSYRHEEIPVGEPPETTFDNRVFSYRGVFEQKKAGRLTGSFGFSGLHRGYETAGAEALAPPVTQNAFAVFTLQTIESERVSFQFGGRFEHTGYTPEHTLGPLPDRSFNGLSGAAGIRVPLWAGGAFVANYTHSYRAPALEELYNNGPHPGNAAFEIGNANLKRERGNGIDVSLRHQSGRVRAGANFFYYRLADFVFLTPTGNITDGLTEAEYLQGDTRYIGGEVNLDVNLQRYVWLTTGMDIVSAQLTRAITSPTTGLTTPADTPLPRIPPVRGRVGFDFRYKGLSIRPEAIIAGAQDDPFPTETRTSGYTVFNLNASYTIAGQHYVHVFAVNSFNLGDRLYRNHLSFIKNIAPEMGRGVRVAYTVRFF